MTALSSLRTYARSALPLLALLTWTTALSTSAHAATKPNIIFILADDLGYGDLGCYGQKHIATPRLDAMAKQGMRFTDAYAGAPSCAPSRCVLMTGLHTGHARIRANSDRPLHEEDITITQHLKKAGYATGAVGKWGLGLQNSTGAPERKGFDEFLGYLDQTHAHTHYPDHLFKNGQRLEIPENKDGQRKVYSQDLFANAALDFIRNHKADPFFLYCAFTLPHAELDAPEDSFAQYRGKWPEGKAFDGSKTYIKQDQPRAARAAMITRLDRDVGRLLDLLDELKLSENTLVIFTSDNGPATAGGSDPTFFDSNGPLRDLKFTLWEGGIRVPFLARWTGKIAPGSTSSFPTYFADMLPTFVELAGAPAPAKKGDGTSIVPTLLGQSNKQFFRVDPLYWEAAPQQALRQADWKLIRRAQDKPAELYDLSKDIGETKDLAKQHPDVAAQFTKLMNESRTESPDFPLAGGEKAKKDKPE